MPQPSLRVKWSDLACWGNYIAQTSEVCSATTHVASREFLLLAGNSLRRQNLGGLMSRDNAKTLPCL